MTNNLIKIPYFLEHYALSRSEFYRQVNAGRIRLTKIGRASRVALADAEAWVASLPTFKGGTHGRS